MSALTCTCCEKEIPPETKSLGIQEDENGDELGELVNCPDPKCGSTVVRICKCGDCLSCELRVMRRRIAVRRAHARALAAGGAR